MLRSANPKQSRASPISFLRRHPAKRPHAGIAEAVERRGWRKASLVEAIDAFFAAA